jgi:hypothetical protein
MPQVWQCCARQADVYYRPLLFRSGIKHVAPLSGRRIPGKQALIEATMGFEPMMRVLQDMTSPAATLSRKLAFFD